MKKHTLSYFAIAVFISVVYACRQQGTNEIKLSDLYVIEVTGENYYWKFRHPGGDGLLHTDDDITKENDLHVPANSDIQLIFKSNDYVYFVQLPELKKTGMAVPGLESPLDLSSGKPGKLQFKGNQMCGFSHSSLITSLTVENKKEFIKYLLTD